MSKLLLLLVLSLVVASRASALVQNNGVDKQLLGKLRDENAQMRRATLDQITVKQARQIVPVLTEMIRDPDESVRLSALSLLARLGPDAIPAIPALVALFRDQDTGRAALAAQHALGELGVHSHSAIPALIEPLSKTQCFGLTARERAPFILEKIGIKDERIVKALTLALQDESEMVRIHAAVVLIRNKTAVDISGKTLQTGLLSNESRIRVQTLRYVAATRLVTATTAVKRLCDSDDTETKLAAMATLTQLAPESPETVGTLIRGLETNRGSIQEMAAFQLGNLGPAAKDALPCLQRVVQASKAESGVRVEAAFALWKIDRANAALATKALVSTLTDSNDLIREVSARKLERMGPSAQDAVRSLRMVSKHDSSANVRLAAQSAVDKICPK